MTTAGSESEDGNHPEKRVRFDWLVTNRLGEFGKYQQIIYLLISLPAISCALHMMSWVFLGVNIKHRCQLYGEDASNSSYFTLPPGRLFNESFPWDSAQGGRWSQCKKYEEVNLDSENVYHSPLSHDNQHVVGCDGKYVFDTSQYKSSARMDFQLICENTVWGTVAETLFKSGILVGSLFFGRLSDQIGRRPVFFYALCQQLTCGIIASFAPNYTIFVIARFLIGMAHSGVFLVAFVIGMELVGKNKRMIAGLGLQYFFAIGYVVVGVLAYFIREWRYLQLALSLPGVLFLSYYWFMPESIRWLLTNGKKEEALKILRRVAAVNKVEIPESELQNLNEEQQEKGEKGKSIGLCEIFKYKKTMLRSLNVFMSWFVNSGVYYGLALNSGNLGGNDYINFILSGAVEFPAYALLLLTLNRFGRKNILCGSMIASGIFLVACGFIPEEQVWLIITLNMMGKLFNAASYATIYLYAGELFPTVIRNSFMGISSMMARVGGILSDYVILTQLVWKPMPHMIFGGISLVSGLSALLLPETLGQRLPETMEDGENLGTPEYDNPKTIHDKAPNSKGVNNSHKESEF